VGKWAYPGQEKHRLYRVHWQSEKPGNRGAVRETSLKVLIGEGGEDHASLSRAIGQAAGLLLTPNGSGEVGGDVKPIRHSREREYRRRRPQGTGNTIHESRFWGKDNRRESISRSSNLGKSNQNARIHKVVMDN